MRLYRETEIRKHADEPTIAMLELWRSLSEQKIGHTIEVMLGNRREHHQLAQYPGELNTAFPHLIEGNVVLSLWLDSFNDVNPLIVSHEIGHWILKLQGFRAFIYRPKIHDNIEIFFNSMIHHPPLYELQRSLGHEPQTEINSRALHNIDIFSNERETNNRQLWETNALLLADDLLNCSESLHIQLKEIINKTHTNTSELLKKILTIAPSYDLLNHNQNIKFSRNVIKNLKLGSSNWRIINEVKKLRSMVLEHQP